MMVKPRIVYFMSFALLAVAISVPFQAAMLYQHSLGELPQIFAKISAPNWLMLSFLAITAALLLQVSPFLKLFVPLSILSLGWNNYLVGSYGADFNMVQTLGATALFSVLFAPLLRRDIRQLLSDPRQRWWLRPHRYHRAMPVVLHPYKGQTIHSHTYDISETGIFIKFDENTDWEALPKVGTRLVLYIQASTIKRIKCEAEVIRAGEALGSYPRGMGLRFTDLEGSKQKSLSQFLKQ